MGVFEFEKFAAGTLAIANCLSGLTDKGSITIIGGGDSVRPDGQGGGQERGREVYSCHVWRMAVAVRP